MNGALPPELERLRRPALLAGAAGLAVALLGLLLAPGSGFIAYLYAYLFWLGVALGSMGFTMIHWLVGGDWGYVTRRFHEAAVGTLPLLAVLFLPLLFGLGWLYSWAVPDMVAHNAVLQHKAAYLNIPGFLLRAAVYFAVWIALGLLLRKWALQADTSNSPEAVRRVQRLSAAGIPLYIVTMTFASVDWVMSREPAYYSTIFGFIAVVGQALTALAFSVLLLAKLSDRPPFATVLKPREFNDLGTLLFTLIILLAYMHFAQFLVNWSGNAQEEITWYLPRTAGAWRWVAGFLIVFGFFVPFFLLLSRYNKQRPGIIAGIALFILFMRLVDLFWMVAPSGTSLHPGSTHWTAVAFALVTPLGIGGIWLAAFLSLLKGRPLLPQHRVGSPEIVGHGEQASPGQPE